MTSFRLLVWEDDLRGVSFYLIPEDAIDRESEGLLIRTCGYRVGESAYDPELVDLADRLAYLIAEPTGDVLDGIHVGAWHAYRTKPPIYANVRLVYHAGWAT